MRLIGLFLIASALQATDVSVRYGDYTSVYRIATGTTGAAAAEPVLTVKNYAGAASHTFVNGDTVYVQNVRGCFDMNGYRKVTNANQGAGTLKLTTIAGAAIVCTAAWVNNYEAGRIGKVATYTLGAHPRLFNTATTDARINGSAAAATIVADNSPAYQGMVARYTDPASSQYALDDPGVCDGKTYGTCTNGERMLTVSAGDVFFGYGLPNMALLWYANQTSPDAPKYLNAIKYALNHIERVVQYQLNNGPSTGGLQYLTLYGKSSEADWVSYTIQGAATAYSFIRSEMTTAERASFTNKILNGIESDTTCTQNLATDASITATSSGTTITTTAPGGFPALSAGDWMLIVTTQASGTGTFSWYKMASSVTAGALTATATTSSTNRTGELYTIAGDPLAYQDWSASTACGLSAIANMHANSTTYGNPAQPATLNQAISGTGSAGDTITITLNGDGAGITLATPFYLYTPQGEWFLISSRVGNSLTAVRGQFYSGVHASSIGVTVIARRWVALPFTLDPYLTTGDWQHNLMLNKQLGFIAAGVALADDDARAVTLLQQAINFYHDYTYFDLSSSATIKMQGGGTIVYQMGRWGNMTAQIEGILQSGMGLDLGGGYLQRYAYYPIYYSWPTTPALGPGDNWMSAGAAPTKLIWLWIMQYFQSGTNEAKYARYWFDTSANANTVSFWRTAGMEAVFYRLLYATAADAAADYTALNPWMIATTVDNPGRNGTYGYPYAVAISKSGWLSGSYLYMNAVNLTSDHDYGDGTFKEASDYIVAYGATSLIGGEAAVGVFGSDAGNNFFEIGGTYGNRRIGSTNWNEVNPSAEGGDRATFDRFFASAAYIYGRLDYKNVWKTAQNVTRGYRSWLHLKPGTGKDYIIVLDDAATSSSNQKRTRIHYHRYGDAANSCTGCTAGSTAIAFKKPTLGAMVSTALLFPAATCSGSCVTFATTTNSYTATIDWGSVAAASMITVNRTSSGSTDTMPTVTIPTTDATSTGVQIDDGGNSFGIIYANDGVDRVDRTITTTYAGNGQIIATGLQSGTYNLYRDGIAYLTPQTVGADGTILFTANGAHAWEVIQGAPSGLLVVSPTVLSYMYTIGGSNPAAQAVAVSTTTVTMDNWSATKTQPWLTLSKSSGIIAESFNVSIDGTGLAAGTYNDTITISTTTATVVNSPQTVAVTLAVNPAVTVTVTTASLPGANWARAYSSTLAASGGTTPYTWTVSSGTLPPGITLSAGGVLSGAATVVGSYSFGVTATDTGGVLSSEKILGIAVSGLPASDNLGGRADATGNGRP